MSTSLVDGWTCLPSVWYKAYGWVSPASILNAFTRLRLSLRKTSSLFFSVVFFSLDLFIFPFLLSVFLYIHPLLFLFSFITILPSLFEPFNSFRWPTITFYRSVFSSCVNACLFSWFLSCLSHRICLGLGAVFHLLERSVKKQYMLREAVCNYLQILIGLRYTYLRNQVHLPLELENCLSGNAPYENACAIFSTSLLIFLVW